MIFDNLKIKEIDAIVKFTPETSSFTTEKRTNHIIGIQLSGRAVHKFENREMTLGSPAIYFFNQKDDYSVNILEKTSAFSIHFETYEPIYTPTFFVNITQTAEIIRLLETMKKNEFSIRNKLQLYSDFYALCAYFNKIYTKKYHPEDERISNAEKYLSAHFREAGCLHHAVQICNLSQRRFNDLFKNHFDITPNKYITNLKMTYAKKLLQTGYLSISQISEMCGFKDIYYFSKVFKKETGYTPSEYKHSDI